MFNQADRRDPEHQRAWVALVDGNNHQIDRIRTEARKRNLKIPIVVDCIHVLEYLWSARWCFFQEGDPAAEQWVSDKARQVLDGRAGRSAPVWIRRARRSVAAEDSSATAATSLTSCCARSEPAAICRAANVSASAAPVRSRAGWS